MFQGYANLPTSLDWKTCDAHAEEGATWAWSLTLMERWVLLALAGAPSELDDHALAHEGRSVWNILAEARGTVEAAVTYGMLVCC
jgi:predicted secreted protein